MMMMMMMKENWPGPFFLLICSTASSGLPDANHETKGDTPLARDEFFGCGIWFVLGDRWDN